MIGYSDDGYDDDGVDSGDQDTHGGSDVDNGQTW